MTKLIPTLFFALFLSPALGDDRPFFAFQNGVHYGSHEKRAEALAEMGYDGIGSATLPKDGNTDSFLQAYRDRGLRVFSIYAGGNLTGDGAVASSGLLESIPKLKGSGVVLEIYLRGDRSKITDGDAMNWIREVAKLAEQSDLEIALYPHSGFYIETIGDAVRIAKLVDRKNVGVMFNLCHFLRIEPDSDLPTALRNAEPLLRQVSVSGADAGGSDWKTLIQPLGQGTYKIRPLLQILDKIGFSGPIGLQCYNVGGSSEVFLKQSFDAWKKLNEPTR